MKDSDPWDMGHKQGELYNYPTIALKSLQAMFQDRQAEPQGLADWGNLVETLGRPECLWFAGKRTRRERAGERGFQRWADGLQVFSRVLTISDGTTKGQESTWKH